MSTTSAPPIVDICIDDTASVGAAADTSDQVDEDIFADIYRRIPANTTMEMNMHTLLESVRAMRERMRDEVVKLRASLVELYGADSATWPQPVKQVCSLVNDMNLRMLKANCGGVLAAMQGSLQEVKQRMMEVRTRIDKALKRAGRGFSKMMPYDLKKMKLAELRYECESRGMDSKGLTRAELIKRVEDYCASPDADSDDDENAAATSEPQ